MREKRCYVPQFPEPSHVAPPTAKQAGKWGLCVQEETEMDLVSPGVVRIRCKSLAPS